MLDSVDKEEEERAKKITERRRDMLRKRISRNMERINNNDPNKRQQHVCTVCDTVRIGSKKLVAMSREELLSKETRIGLGSFQEHYEMELHPELVRQYKRVGLEGLLLSPRARELKDGSVEVCESCRNSLRRSQESPPR